MENQMLSVSDAAKRVYVTGAAVRLWIRCGKLKASKVGRMWFIKPEDLETFQTKYDYHVVG